MHAWLISLSLFLWRYEFWTYVNCQYVWTRYSGLLNATTATPTFITLAIAFAGVFSGSRATGRELYLLWVAAGTWILGLTRHVLSALVNSPFPLESCRPPDETSNFPDYTALIVSYYVTTFLTYTLIQGSDTLGVIYVVFCVAWSLMTNYALHYLNFATISQIGLGAVLGAAFAFFFQLLFALAVRPFIPWLLKTFSFLNLKDSYFSDQLQRLGAAEKDERRSH